MGNKLQDWNFNSRNVDDEVLKNGENYISSESIVLAVGHPTLDDPDFDWSQLYVIGVIQSIDYATTRQIQQLFEIGSKHSYFIPGRSFVNLAISRVLVNGPSLLKALYKVTGGTRPSLENLAENKPGDPYDPNYNPETGENPESDALFYPNLTSSFFNRPVGLMAMFHDSEDDPYGAIYFENCFIQANQVSLSSQQTFILENVQIRCQRVRPINVGATL